MNSGYQDHFEWAQNCLTSAENPKNREFRDYYTARAQVHATLALAAATRANKTVTVREDRP